MKALCVVDTSSLIYLSEIELANKSLHRWLWDEFKVVYSQSVWNEIQNSLTSMGNDAKWLRKGGDKSLWPLPTMTTYEQVIFTPPFYRKIETGVCRRCGRPFLEDRLFEPNLSQEDRGERHNCCVALDVVLTGQYRQVIFLTDDYLAIRNYVNPIFEIFPLGTIWSSQDLVLYLFMRHRKYIPTQIAQEVLRDIVAKATATFQTQPEEKTRKAKEEWRKRLTAYRDKIKRIDQVLRQLGREQ